MDAANSNADNSAAVSSLGAAKTELAAAEKELAAAEKVNDSVKDFDEANLTKLLNDYNEAVSASEAAGSVSEPTAGNPDSTTAADFSKGRYKGTEDSSSFTVTLDYYIYADWREDNQQFSVSPDEYKAIREGDCVQICLRRSIFGLHYWNVHK